MLKRWILRWLIGRGHDGMSRAIIDAQNRRDVELIKDDVTLLFDELRTIKKKTSQKRYIRIDKKLKEYFEEISDLIIKVNKALHEQSLIGVSMLAFHARLAKLEPAIDSETDLNKIAEDVMKERGDV